MAKAPGDDVLIVEDSEDLRATVVELLEEEGYRVSSVPDGRAALAYLSTVPPPRLIMLDLAMPAMDGWAFRAAQRAVPSLADVPVVVLTGVMELDRRAPLHVAAKLRKPFNLETLLATVARFVRPA